MTTATMSPAARARRIAFMKNQAGRIAAANAEPATPPAEHEEEPKCRPCGGEGVDRFGFDCTTCFGTGEAE